MELWQSYQVLQCKAEKMINRFHSVRFWGHFYHPYFIFHDISMVGIALIAASFGPWAFKLAVPVYIALASYSFYLRFIKRKILGTSVRSFLLDSLVWIFPILALGYAITGLSFGLTMRFLALVFAWHITMTRLGCFFSGCCYGIESKWGIRYSPNVFVAHHHFRLFSPGRFQQARVLPVQLIESVFCFFIFILLMVKSNDDLRHFLIYYCLFRFMVDFLRKESVLKRFGVLSNSQVICLIALPGLIYWIW